MDDLPPLATHAVCNPLPPFEPCNLWADDLALREAVARDGGDAFQSSCTNSAPGR